jgi:hypothetical protein
MQTSLVGYFGVMAMAAMLILGGCSTPPRTSTLTVEDLEETTSQMAGQLGSSDFLRERTAESPPIVVAIDKVQNLTSDVIPEGQQWFLVSRVRDQLDVGTLRKSKNIRFVIPREFLDKAKAAGTIEADAGLDRAPTHQMSATFHSMTRTAGKDRTDAYVCEYRITEIGSGALAWTGEFAFKRTAFGKAYD